MSLPRFVGRRPGRQHLPQRQAPHTGEADLDERATAPAITVRPEFLIQIDANHLVVPPRRVVSDDQSTPIDAL